MNDFSRSLSSCCCGAWLAGGASEYFGIHTAHQQEWLSTPCFRIPPALLILPLPRVVYARSTYNRDAPTTITTITTSSYWLLLLFLPAGGVLGAT